MSEFFELPAKPFFSCEEDGFIVADGAQMRTASAILSIEPLLTLRVAPNNVFEQKPLRVIEQNGSRLAVECAGGETVHLDFHELTARKQSSQGSFLYLGGLERGNDGLGFMPAQ